MILKDLLTRDGGKLGIIAGAIAVLGLVLLLTYCAGRKDGSASEANAQLERSLELEQDASKADAEAADQRMEDAARIAAQEKELDDALKAADDPATQRIVRGCIILRQQGRDVSQIAACQRFAPGR